MTTLDIRTPAVIDGAFVETPTGPSTPPPMPAPKLGEIVPGERQYVRNPHLTSVSLAAGVLFGAAGGALWSVFSDDDRADLAFGALLAAVVVLVVCVRRFNAWDQA